MQKSEIKKFHIISFIFVSILGTILHFLYSWSGENFIVGAFSAVNESIWEHLKLIFYPMLISSVIGYFIIGKEIENYWCARVKGILVAIVFVVVFFYTYVGILGKIIDIINIVSFYVTVFIGEYVSYRNILKDNHCDTKFSFFIIAILLLSFITFTYITPPIGIFKDPRNNTYGIYNKL